jgi:hypothetical protein
LRYCDGGQCNGGPSNKFRVSNRHLIEHCENEASFDSKLDQEE